MKRLDRIGRILIFASLVLVTLLFMVRCHSGFKPAKRVILIGIDGMGVSGFQQARTPVLDALAKAGALSFRTRGVMPTVSGPNWGSHLLGAGPEQHGITNNGWTTDNYTVEPTEKDADGYFPSIFRVIRDQMPDAITGFFYDWDALANLYNLETIDRVEFSRTFDSTFIKATPWIIQNKPDFTFLYVGHPDEEGHAHQWGSKEYLKALEDVDRAIGEFLDALKEASLYEDTHFIVVTDHGGIGTGHGGLSMEEIEVPWFITGPGIIRDRMIEQPGDVFNTASTIAFLFDLEQPDSWIGRPVLGAFEHHSSSRENNAAYVPQPVSSIESGFYPQAEAVAFEVSTGGVDIRYTTNGNDPNPSSPTYKTQILLQKSTTLKAAAFRDGASSRVTQVDFRKIVPARDIRLTNPPDDKYAGNGPFMLLDRKTGSSKFDDGLWSGFRASDLEARITFADKADISKVSLGLLNLPGSWIFPPLEIAVMASVDGETFREIGRMDENQIRQRMKKGRTELTIKITPAQTRYLFVVAKNVGVCPPGHAAAGEPAWLFVDEIVIE